MTNVEKILFDAKYSLHFVNGIYVLSGFNHTDSIHINEEDIADILNDEALPYFDEEDWMGYIKTYKENHKN